MNPTATSPFEQLGRERKAQSIATALWLLIPAEDRSRTDLGAKLANVPQDQRNAVAVAAGKQIPSKATWERVCAIVDEKAAEERHLVVFLDRIEASA